MGSCQSFVPIFVGNSCTFPGDFLSGAAYLVKSLRLWGQWGCKKKQFLVSEFIRSIPKLDTLCRQHSSTASSSGFVSSNSVDISYETTMGSHDNSAGMWA